MKAPFTFADGPMAECHAANVMTIDSSLVGVEPVPGDARFVCRWDRTRVGRGTAAGLYRFVRGEDGKVTAHHVPGPDDKLSLTDDDLKEAAARRAVEEVRKLALEHPEVAAMLKEGEGGA